MVNDADMDCVHILPWWLCSNQGLVLHSWGQANKHYGGKLKQEENLQLDGYSRALIFCFILGSIVALILQTTEVFVIDIIGDVFAVET